jgi:hypothetical protein
MRGEQLKLFGAGDESDSKPKRRLIVMPLDTFILSSVVIFLLFILAFSLGVEKGRKISIVSDSVIELPANNMRQEVIPVVTQDRNLIAKPQKIVVSGQPVKAGTPVVQVTRNVQIADKKIDIPQVASPKEGYYIQIATYNKDSFAQEEVKRLKSRGFLSYTAKRGDFVVLYVGTFSSMAEAQKNMGLLKKNYKDCILRRL